MTNPLTPSEKECTLKRPSNGGEFATARGEGKITGFFKPAGGLKKGRPPNKKKQKVDSVSPVVGRPSARATAKELPKKRCRRTTVKNTNWSKHPHVLQKYVDNFRKSRKYKLLTPAPLEPVPKKPVIYKYYKGISSHENKTGNRLTVEEYIKCYRKPVGNQSITLTIDQRQRVNNIIVRRDARRH